MKGCCRNAYFWNWFPNVSCRKVAVTLQTMLKSCWIVRDRMLKCYWFESQGSIKDAELLFCYQLLIVEHSFKIKLKWKPCLPLDLYNFVYIISGWFWYPVLFCLILFQYDSYIFCIFFLLFQGVFWYSAEYCLITLLTKCSFVTVVWIISSSQAQFRSYLIIWGHSKHKVLPFIKKWNQLFLMHD